MFILGQERLRPELRLCRIISSRILNFLEIYTRFAFAKSIVLDGAFVRRVSAYWGSLAAVHVVRQGNSI